MFSHLFAPRFLELKEYILKRRDELAPVGGYPTKGGAKGPMGAELSQAELMGEEPASRKGFAKK